MVVVCEVAIGVFVSPLSVSPLSELIFENAIFPIRVGGIKAHGLDDDMDLIVERSPRIDYFARSAPQLLWNGRVGGRLSYMECCLRNSGRDGEVCVVGWFLWNLKNRCKYHLINKQYRNIYVKIACCAKRY